MFNKKQDNMKKIFSCVLALFAAASMFAASDLNIYASGLKAVQQDTMVTVYYTLNTQASALQLMIYGENINSAMAMSIVDPAAMTKGAHELTLPLPNDVPAAAYHWAVKATADTTSFVDALNGAGMYNYYLPQDVAVDNNYESPFFGRVYVSESCDGASDGGSDATKAQVRGIYMYNADMTFVNGDSMALNGYDGGIGGARDGRQAIKRIAIDNAGYVYIASRDAASKGIYRMDPANPTAPFVQIYSAAETVDAIGIEGNYLYTIEGIGVGAGTLNRYALANPLGAAIATMGQDTILHFASGDCDAMPDGRGGWWFAEHRWNKDAYPCLAHMSANGVRDFYITNDSTNGHADLLTQSHNASYRGVVTVSPDGSMVAMGSDKSAVVFSVSYDATTGVPTLVRIFTTPKFGTNIDGVAFDVANNLYVASASSERLYAFPIPKVQNEFVTPAPMDSKVYIGVPMPVQQLYLIGDITGWNPTQGQALTKTADNVFEGVFTFPADSSYFALFTALAENNDNGGWDYVNANRYAGATDGYLLNKAYSKDTMVQANQSLRMALAGQYKIRADFNANKITVFRQAPAAIPDNALYIAFKDVPGKEGGDNSSAVTSIDDIIESGADLVSAIPLASKIYNAREGCGVKFGTGSAKGELTLTLANAVIPSSITVYATAYSATEGSAVLLGDTVNLAAAGNKVIVAYTKTYDGTTPISELTFATTEKRMYLLDVVINPAGEMPHNVYRIKHPWDLNNIDPWIWKECEEQADGTWKLEDLYWGGGCNIDPKVLDQEWIGTPTLVGNPYSGDSCAFVINPAATDVAGILTITKLGEPNPDTTQVVVYEHLYEIGDNQGWHPAQAIEMTNKSQNVFEGTFDFAAVSYFGFITVKPETDDWTITNANRFGPQTKDMEVTPGTTAIFKNDNAFKIQAGNYTFTLDLNAMEITIVKNEVGIHNVNGENNVQKVLRNGQIFIIRDGETYTVTGAKVQ